MKKISVYFSLGGEGVADEVKVDGVGVVLVHCGVGGGWGGAGMRTCNSRLLLMGRVGADKAQGFYSTSYPLVCPQVSQDNSVWNRILKEVVIKTLPKAQRTRGLSSYHKITVHSSQILNILQFQDLN